MVAVLTGASFTSLAQREQGVSQAEIQDVLLGAQISVVKQPYAYFNKELGQQIVASDVERNAVSSPKIQSSSCHGTHQLTRATLHHEASSVLQRDHLLGRP